MAAINWANLNAVRSYKAGYMRALRACKYKPRPGASELAKQVMWNEFERARRKWKDFPHLMLLAKEQPVDEGNEAWKALEASNGNTGMRPRNQATSNFGRERTG